MWKNGTAMLDLPTLLLLLTVTVILQGLVWLLVWLTQRHLYELKLIAAGYISFGVGLMLQALRDHLPLSAELTIILYNYASHIGAAMLAQGAARFLDQRGMPRMTAACIVAVIVYWPAAMILAPGDVATRIIVSNSIATILLWMLVRTIWIDRSQPLAIRIFTMAILASDIVALSVRTVVAYTHMDDQAKLMTGAVQAWYFFYFNIFVTGLFLSLLLMVGVRLAADLRRKNDDLVREVAQRRALQDQLGASLETEKALREEQHQLLRMVTHEFRTPLAIIDRAAEMIDVVLEHKSEAVIRRLASIREAVQRLVQLTDRFLNAERSSFDLLQPERIDIPALFDGVARHFEGMDAATRLHFRADRGLPYYWGDPDMLTTVLINLIDNAVKYAPDDSPIEIAAQAGRDSLLLSVTDHGIGIPAAEAGLIGRRFFRASNTKPATGTGLGLHNARQLLGYHHGTLALQPGPDGGTIAAVHLPLPGPIPAPNETIPA